MLTLQRTAAPVRTERESIAMVYNYGNGRTTVEHVPSVPDTVVDSLSISNKFIADSNARKSAKTAADHAEFSSHDWTNKPSSWSREAVLYYLEFVCGETVTHEDKDGTDLVTVQNLARAEYKFRKANTQHASARVPRAALLNAVKNAKKLNPRSPAKTVSLRINGSLDVITSDTDARFSQSVDYVSKSGDLRLTFPDQRLQAIASKLKADTLDLELSSLPVFDEYILTVKSDSATFTIPVEIPDDSERFISEFPASFAHNVTAGELLRAFRMTEFSVCTESTRYALSGLFIVPGENSLDIAATDSRRLSVETIPAEVLGTMPEIERGETRHGAGVVIPIGIVNLLQDELKRHHAGNVVSFATADVIIRRKELTPPDNLTKKQRENWEPSTVGFVCLSDGVTTTNIFDGMTYWQQDTRTEFVFEMPGAFSIRGVPVQGRFPRYLDVIPGSFESKYEIQRTAILEQCETILLSTDEESRGVEFVFPVSESDRNVRLAAKSATLGTASAIFHCESVDSTERRTITLDPKYVIDYLKRSQAGFITIQIQDSETAILITADDSDGKYVQMPLSQDR